MSSTFNKFNDFTYQLSKKIHDLSADTFKWMLTNTLPVAANALSTDITEIGTGNGYSAGGVSSTPTLSTSSGTAKLILSAPTAITASGGTIGPFRYAVLYNNTAASKNLVGWFDYGSNQTLNIGETFNIVPDATNGVLTIV